MIPPVSCRQPTKSTVVAPNPNPNVISPSIAPSLNPSTMTIPNSLPSARTAQSTSSSPSRRHSSKLKVRLTTIAFFLGDLRDGLTLLNLQAVYLLTVSSLPEKTIGGVFLCFGVAQILFSTPLSFKIEQMTTQLEVLLAMGACTVLLT